MRTNQVRFTSVRERTVLEPPTCILADNTIGCDPKQRKTAECLSMLTTSSLPPIL